MSQPGSKIAFDNPVDEIMRRWPSTIRVFLRFRMACVGCPIAGFHTVADACREHQVDPAAFLAELRAAASGDTGTVSIARTRVLGNAEQPVRIA
jgi:hybrid cluster-associated redox disulfide protein